MQSASPSPLPPPQDALPQGVQRILLTETDIQQRISEMAGLINSDYAGLNPLFVGVLKGVVFFMADLLRGIMIPMRMDFMAISRYNSQEKRMGAVRLIKDLDEGVKDQHIIFVEDVIDTGLTLNYLLRTLRARGPASLEVCVLFNKPAHRLVDIPLKYRGFDLPDRFVVGYGLDYKEQYRNLSFVGELKPEVLHLKA